MSLHADMLPKAQAAGATIYVWNPASNDRAAQDLAEPWRPHRARALMHLWTAAAYDAR